MKTILRFQSIELFETSRMLVERIKETDFEDFFLTHSDVRVAANLGGVVTKEVAQNKFAWNLQQWIDNNFGLWIFRSKNTNCFVGRGGLRRVQVNGKEEIEVGYALMPEFWGVGYATEIAKASVEVAFNVLNIAEIVCFTATTNIASRRVMEKAGFKYDQEIMHSNCPHLLYRLKIDDKICN